MTYEFGFRGSKSHCLALTCSAIVRMYQGFVVGLSGTRRIPLQN
jgi:hypothetical protein